jgi:putative transposase
MNSSSQPSDNSKSATACAVTQVYWPHAPTHRLGTGGTFIVTAGTYLKEHHFQGEDRLRFLHAQLLYLAHELGWHLEAWAVFSNHYHFVGHSPESSSDATSLSSLIRTLHVTTSGWVNKLDHQLGRVVWFNYWETRLTFEKSYRARLNYVHQNPVRHGIVPVANQYRWCSAAWFERTASAADVRNIYGFKMDRVNVVDDFD